MNSKQRSKLRSLAHHLKPVVFVGKAGVTTGTITSISKALDVHELIKVKFSQNKKSKQDLADRVEQELSAFIVGGIGHTLIIYRAQEDVEKRNYNI